MATLVELLTHDAKRQAVVSDVCAMIDSEVSDKGGISGLAIKAGYGAIRNIRPDFVRSVVNDLLPEFAANLDPIYQEAVSQNRAVSVHFNNNSGRVADALLAITDAKSQRAKSALVKGTYDKLRGQAKKNVEAAVPRLGKVIEKYSA